MEKLLKNEEYVLMLDFLHEECDELPDLLLHFVDTEMGARELHS